MMLSDRPERLSAWTPAKSVLSRGLSSLTSSSRQSHVTKVETEEEQEEKRLQSALARWDINTKTTEDEDNNSQDESSDT